MRGATAPVAAAAVVVVVALAACGGAAEPPAPGRARPVRLALDFTPNAVHAGIFATVLEGHDRARGLELRIRPPASGPDSLKLLSAGRTDLGVLDIHDLGLARERGVDVVGVGALVHRPLAAVIARAGVRRPRELEGRRVGVTGLPSDDAVLRAVVEDDGGDFGRVRRVTIGFSAVPSLIAGKVDAVTAFWNVEGVALRERGVRTREFRVDEFGAPRYPEVVLIAMRRTLERDRRLVADAVAALTAGTRSALRDPGPALRRIAAESGGDAELVRAEFEAVRPTMRPTLELDRRSLEAWAAWDDRFGLLRSAPAVERAFALGLASPARAG